MPRTKHDQIPAGGTGPTDRRGRASAVPPVSADGAASPWLAGLILDHTRDGIVLLDIFGRILWMNPALERMLGWTLAEVRGRNPAELITPPEARPGPAALAQFRYDPGSSLFRKHRVTRHMRRDGTLFWNQQSHALIDLGPGDTQKMVVVTCRDISDEVRVQMALQRMTEDLDHAAHHDDLTGLANRKRLSDFLASPPARTSLRAGVMGVLQLDLDRFKDINDTMGHAAGDAVLRHVAAALANTAEERDLPCRTGGDEFLVVCLDIGDRTRLMRRAQAVLDAATRPLAWQDQIILPGISVGASMPGAGSDVIDGEALIRQADQALYSAKDRGRGRAVLYTPELGRRHRDGQRLAHDLKLAVEQGQFCVHLQPIAHLAQSRVTGCEALLRWRHPGRGMLAPAAFLPAAEQAGLLSEIDYHAMNAALDALSELRAQGFPDLVMSLNVSSSILADADYPALLDWGLQSRGLPPQAVCVEILEMTMMTRGTLDVTGAVTALRRLGVRVALDDFGTGYAGLAHMSAAPIDAIKLDRTMICRLGHDARARVITRSIIRLCALLGVDVIAAGVETQDQLDILRRAKCPQVQGYGLARPMPLPDLSGWLRAHTPFAAPITMPRGLASGLEAPCDPPPRPNATDGKGRRRDTSI
ncbi:putative bifunctional diguanylate cyclase/phosphodiesterase [Roseovarius sp. S1116L3]|uniref:putative bifunctional diguanylate cyclase/phosphodiesterase n=1 Tax=Roseovarius roseus TaxID=3342636 RepID=UPI0037296D30